MKLFIPALVIAAISGLAAIASPPSHLLKRATVTDAQQSLSLITADLDVLTSSVNALPTSGATITDVIPIGLNCLILLGSMAETLADFQSLAGTIPILTATNILTTVQSIEGAIVTVVNILVSKKTAIEGVLPGASVFALKTFRTWTSGIASAMAAVAPITIPASTITTIRNALDTTFATAITTFGG
ncbi:hypothetical protein M422DRAFT_265659 [Sphaerobolus stellatus SS14]|uniref:Uncharacterized protein n=1 Tax=Sphaerobolus stellatus (strain SS14) TaxID=990650 RepID=A0A0C9UCS4_SPHS4|nr:hypothetical protein M422DRAFT_265659 [Sphaerobolus stellatus SS14]